MTTSQWSRRDLLHRTTLSAAALSGVLAGPTWAKQAPSTQPSSAPAGTEPKLPYNKFGKQGYPVTKISLGAIRLDGRQGSRVLKAAIDAGVNLVHTSMSYNNGGSLKAVAGLLKAKKEYRDKILLCLKSYTPQREEEIDEMLDPMEVEFADFCFPTMHDPDLGRLELIQESLDKLIKKGKIKHKGFVCHGDMNGVMEMVLDKAPDYFDATLMSVAMIPVPPEGRGKRADKDGMRFLRNLRKFKEAGIGVLSMKSGARSAVTQGQTVFEPHAKAVLETGADSILTSIDTFQQVEMVTKLDIKDHKPTAKERQAARDFQRLRSNPCMMCGRCTGACPVGVPVNDLMRLRLYNNEYGWKRHARAEFDRFGGSRIRRLISQCGDCSACAKVCPVGLAGPDTIRSIVSCFG